MAAIEAAGGTAAYAVADVGLPEEVAAAADAALARFGRIDTWVNNAGTAIYARLVDTPLDEHQRMVRTNYFGCVNGCMAAVARMRDTGGAIITVGSIASDIPSPILGAYAATKHAAKGYVDALRMELTADAVPLSITLIKPSGIDTPIAQHAANHVEGEAMIPPPVYDPSLVADAILDAAGHVRREVTVGGVGRAQVMFGLHFPGVLDRMAGLLIPALMNRKKPRTEENSVLAPRQRGQERSGVQPGRKFSVYTSAERHKLAIVVGLAAVGGVGFLALRSGRPQAKGRRSR